jgi:SAM-dependent methyltransferase
MKRLADFFEEAYGNVDRYWWRHPHVYSTSPRDHAGSLMAQQVLRFALSRVPGTAIDLGAGEGADAIRLARLGWDVTAVELTSAGAQKIRRFAEQADVSIQVIRADASDFSPNTQYDLVICNGVLHYIENKVEMCLRMQQMTKSGGANAISLWSTYTPVPHCHQIVPTFPDDEDGVVSSLYAQWTHLLFYFERMRREMGHDDMPQHMHSFIKLVSLKP